MKHNETIGIIGGMGPGASAHLYQRMNELAVEEYGAKQNDDFPEIILCSVPVPDFISSTKNKDKALRMLMHRVKQLHVFSLTAIGIACNTAHIFLPDLQKDSKTKFISMIEQVCHEIFKRNFKTIGLLATSSTIQAGLYQRILAQKKVQTVILSQHEQKTLDRVIKAILGQKAKNKEKEVLISVANTLAKQGVQALILGCTELPLLFPKQYGLPVFSSVEILARALLERSYEKRRR